MFNENLQSLKKILSTTFRKNGLFTLSLVGKNYQVCYEASHYKEERDYAIIKSLAKDKYCIFDVGANVGTSTLLLAEQNQASIYAFEASEYACKIVLQNMIANKIDNRVTVVNSLIGDKTGEIIPFYWAFSSGGASIFKGRLGHNFLINKVSLTLDDYVRANGLKPDLFKIDVEGAELMVLTGALNTLLNFRPIVFLELHAMESLPLWQHAEQVLSFLKKCNYKMIYLKTKEEVVDASILKGRGRCHVLLHHQDDTMQSILNQLETAGL